MIWTCKLEKSLIFFPALIKSENSVAFHSMLCDILKRIRERHHVTTLPPFSGRQ